MTTLGNPIVALTILTGLATLMLGILTTFLGPNLIYMIRQWIPGEPQRGGRPPAVKSSSVWAAYWGCAAIVIFGAALIVFYEPILDRQKEIMRSKVQMAKEIQLNLTHLTIRLDSVENKFQNLHPRVQTPVLKEKSEFYTRLAAMQQAAVLDSLIINYPLYKDLEPSVLVNLPEDEVTINAIRSFYSQINQIEKTFHSLKTSLSKTATVHEETGLPVNLREKQLQLELTLLKRLGDVVKIDGWNLIKNLLQKETVLEASLFPVNSSSDIERTISITPPTPEFMSKRRQFVDEASLLDQSKTTLDFMIQTHVYESNQPHYYNQANLVLTRLESLLKGQTSGEKDFDREIATFEKQAELQRLIYEELKIEPADPWNIVVAKATSRRQLGYKAEAIDAFRIYREMFSSTDPTAELYARIAQLFTIQTEELELDGGIYIYEIQPGSKAESAGLKAGDIIINYAGYLTENIPDFIIAREASTKAEKLNIQYLRADSDGYLQKNEITITGSSPIGCNVMPV